MINRDELKAVIKEVVEEVLLERGLVKTCDDDLIDVDATAKLLKLAKATVYEKTSQKVLPHSKKGKKVVSRFRSYERGSKVGERLRAMISSK